ncbi:efflux RND transporter periplasmic adaptor subunit [Ginsengibacter hankyongi]|uniref:efflux RND transporter periplasmic adaptor subunit n=1 Tax=Ginsengibacter hankyongi TaxID=2607284 RepID=UPI001F295BFC|nr:efflux RND transporter periplasmic adaptor subunit [Ginsengibacter hankyongi]
MVWIKQTLYIIFFLIILQSCDKRQVKIHPAKENITESVYASGIVKSRDQYEVFSPVNGLIQKIFVREGDTVKKNDAIIEVKSETAKLNIENAKLTLENAEVRANMDKLNEAQTNIIFLKSKLKNDSSLLERQRNLWNNNIGTRNELEQRELAYKNDLASYKGAVYRYDELYRQLNFNAAQSKNNLKINQTLANDFIIKSRINGKVYSLAKEDGEMVTTQSPIAVIGGTGSFILELEVDEYDIEKIKPGQKVLITMDSYKNKIFEATVTRIIPFMNDRTRSFTIEGTFDTKPPVLYPNLTVEANILIQSKENVITIPLDYLIDDSLVRLTADKKRKVITGLKDYQKVEILSGLSVGDEIIKPEQ